MNIDAFNFLGVNIAGDVIPLVDDQNGLACRAGLLGENCAKETAPTIR